MVQNTSTTPATGGNTTFTGTGDPDQLSGGGGSDTIYGGGGSDLLTGDAPQAGQWQYSVYDYNFSSANNQTQFITSGTLVGHGYVDDFSVLALRNTLGGTAAGNDRNDFGIVYRSSITIQTTGTYTFSTTSDDGSRIIIRDANGDEVFNLNNDFHQPAATRSGTVTLTAGQTYTIEVLYWENQGLTTLSGTIAGPGFAATDLATSPLIGTPPLAPGHVDGDDRLFGEGGADTIFGNGGSDLIYGGTSTDLLYGGTGTDTLHGDAGNDTLYGDAGDDLLYGGTGLDLLYGGIDADVLFGDTGNDTLSGDAGEDLVYGGDNADLIYGGDGGDTIFGGSGADTMYGGFGTDRFVHDLGDASNDEVVVGGEDPDNSDIDVLDLSAFGNAYGWSQVAITYTGAESGTVILYNADRSQILGTITFSEIERVIPCFTAGMLIETPDGPRPAESLRPGDLVLTLDHGPQPLSWVGIRHLSLAELIADPTLVPVRFAPGSLGAAMPERPLTVSPQHRLLFSGASCELYFGELDVLAPAVHLTDRPGVTRPLRPVTYVHLMCARHQMLRSHGVWSESYQPGDRTLDGMPQPQREELLRLFPDLPQGDYRACRSTLRAHETRILLAEGL